MQSTSTSAPSAPSPRRGLWLVLAVHLVLGGTYLAVLPLWGAVPDEPLHYSRAKYEGEFQRWPAITDPRFWGEPLSVYCFTADPCGTSQHGPLYYTPAAIVFRLTRGLTVKAQQYALRGWSLLLGGLMVWLSWLLLREVFDDEATVTAGTLLVCLLPHRLMLSAVIYNDIACGAATAWYLLLLVRAAKSMIGGSGGLRPWLHAGLALGLAYLAKRIVLVTVPGSLVLIWLWHRRSGRPRDDLARAVGAWMLGFLMTAGWWLALDAYRYGELLPMEPGLGRGTWGALLSSNPLPAVLGAALMCLRGLWLSVWSQVGWVPLHDGGPAWSLVAYGLYGALAILVIAATVGLLRRRGDLPTTTREVLLAFLLMLLGMVYGALHWVLLASLHGIEETGKHAVVLLPALAALVLAGWQGLAGAARGRRLAWLAAGLLLLFNLASLTRLTTYLIPTWAPPDPPLAGRRVRDLPSGAAPGIWHRYRVPGVRQEGGVVDPPRLPVPPTLRRE